jgi:hypothetical protein
MSNIGKVLREVRVEPVELPEPLRKPETKREERKDEPVRVGKE